MKPKVASCDLYLQLRCGMAMSVYSCLGPDTNPSLISCRLDVIERKLDTLLLSQVPQDTSAKDEYIPNLGKVFSFGTSSEQLSLQCAAVRALQRWWRRVVQISIQPHQVDRHYFFDLEASKATHDDGACSESSERHIVESEHVCPAFSATVDMQAEAEGDESDVAVSDLEDSSDEPSEEGQDNSAEAVAVRRAFLASVHSSAPHVAGSQDDEVTWTGDQILSWITEAMDLAVAADDRRKRVKNLWLDWSRLDHFLPQSHRQQIVRRLDQKLMENDYPGLRSMMSEMAEISLCEQAEATADQEAHSIIDAAAHAAGRHLVAVASPYWFH